MRVHIVAACFLLLASASVLAQQTGSNAQGAAATGQFNLAAFSNITSCLPFNVLIKPGAKGSTEYTLTTSVAPEVDAALRIAVSENTLYLGFNRSFESTVPIRITVTMPADKLEVIDNKGMGHIILNPGGWSLCPLQQRKPLTAGLLSPNSAGQWVVRNSPALQQT